ncbi:hypothetical protein EVAR_59062_1 [Eumeta japonica]|uniref:Uncharacterized protein n=1 Tax=Eumeta variegata TaxID=151549 RepID=A0A4C1YCT9_EUMVA|nr:hypothetical protein EVAR_59062_1 [Eumeta japonica]
MRPVRFTERIDFLQKDIPEGREDQGENSIEFKIHVMSVLKYSKTMKRSNLEGLQFVIQSGVQSFGELTHVNSPSYWTPRTVSVGQSQNECSAEARPIEASPEVEALKLALNLE